MERHHKEYEERCWRSDREDKERDLEDQWIIVVGRDHPHAHQKKRQGWTQHWKPRSREGATSACVKNWNENAMTNYGLIIQKTNM